MDLVGNNDQLGHSSLEHDLFKDLSANTVAGAGANCSEITTQLVVVTTVAMQLSFLLKQPRGEARRKLTDAPQSYCASH